jgi:hypothetical protein
VSDVTFSAPETSLHRHTLLTPRAQPVCAILDMPRTCLYDLFIKTMLQCHSVTGKPSEQTEWIFVCVCVCVFVCGGGEGGVVVATALTSEVMFRK